MAKELELDCPSGLRVRLRGIKGKDLDGLRDKRKVSTGEAFSRLLDDCTLEVLAPGPYTVPQGSKFSWKQALMGDRVRGLCGLRAATSGVKYAFRVRCGNEDCKAHVDWELDVLDLPVTTLSESSREKFLNGNRFETEVAGRRVIFQLSTGETQSKIVRLREQFASQQKRQRERGEDVQDGQTLLGLACRIVEVEGVSNVVPFLGELELADLNRLVREMDKVDCGVETTFDIYCSECGEATSTELPLDQRFFRPTETAS